jgi:tetratricopeptide (TPR) repeat protein
MLSCENEMAKTDHKHTHSTDNTDSSNVQVVDEVPLMKAPGSKIEKDKVFALLEDAGLSFAKLASPNATKEELQKSIKTLKRLLSSKQVSNDIELEFIVHNMLTSSYLRLYDLSSQNDLLNKANDHADTAISIFENKPKYIADLAQAHTGLLATLSLKQEYHKAIPIMKNLIEDYQNIGYGPFKNWFACDQVKWLHSLAGKESLKPEKREDIISYISKTAESYNNEVGVTAQISLAYHQIEKEGPAKTKPLLKSIKSNVAMLDNPTFKKHTWEPFKRYLEAQNNVNSHHHE